jgi:hypothetical protein
MSAGPLLLWHNNDMSSLCRYCAIIVATGNLPGAIVGCGM